MLFRSMIALISFLSLPLALAQEAQAPSTSKDPAQPVVSATAASEPEKAMTQTLNSYVSGSSIDFLMEEPPLTQSTVMEAASPVPVPVPSTAPATLEVLQGTVIKETDEVAMLVSEQCSQSGGATEG